MFTLTGPGPDWATKKRNDGITRPSAKQYGRWVTAVARRFGDRVDLWSIWNEPNHPRFLGAAVLRRAAASPRIYRALYLAGEKAIHGVPGGGRDKVLFGETAPVGTSTLVEPLVFLRRALCLSDELQAQQGLQQGADGGLRAPRLRAQGQPVLPLARQDEVSIGTLDRLTKALDRAAEAGAIKRKRPIYLTEFGVQSYPDKLAGVPLRKQAEYLAISEHIAYVNRRVKAFSQYLMRDDKKGFGQGKTERYGGFETGLRRANGKQEAGLHRVHAPAPRLRGGRQPRALGPRPARDGAGRRDDPARHGRRLEAADDDAHRRGRRVRPRHAGARRRALPRALDAGGRGDLHRAAHPPVLSASRAGAPRRRRRRGPAPPAARTSARAAASRAAIARVARDRLGVGADRGRVLGRRDRAAEAERDQLLRVGELVDGLREADRRDAEPQRLGRAPHPRVGEEHARVGEDAELRRRRCTSTAGPRSPSAAGSTRSPIASTTCRPSPASASAQARKKRAAR